MIKNLKKWKKYEKLNKDPYGRCCVDIARQAMKNLDDTVMDDKFDPHDFIIRAMKEVGESGITGFMAWAIAQMIIDCHEQGDKFRVVWNKYCGGTGEEGNVIDPTTITIKIK